MQRREARQLAITRRTVLLIVFAAFGTPLHAQDTGMWNGKRSAVVLTYDDALDVHLDSVVPLLDSLGLRGSFYVTGFFPGFVRHVDRWRAVAEGGHELGNHTVFHPCAGSPPGRAWVRPDYDLDRYTVRRMADEILMQNVLLEALDGKKHRTFAYPCGDTRAGDSSYVGEIRDAFLAARGVEGKMERPDEIDWYDVGAYVVNGQPADELIGLVRAAMDREALLVFLFHGVGGGHSLDVSLEAHRALVQFLKEHEQEIWVAPLAEVAEYETARPEPAR